MGQWRRRKMRMRNNRSLLLQALGVAVALLILCGAAQANGKTIYVHILDGDDVRGDGSYSRPYKSWRVVLSHEMTARNNLVISTRPGERPVEPIVIWAAKNASIINNTFIGIGERGVLLVRPGNEVDSPAKGCGRSVR